MGGAAEKPVSRIANSQKQGAIRPFSIPCWLIAALGIVLGGLYPGQVLADHLEELRHPVEISRISDTGIIMGGIFIFMVLGSLIVIGLNHLKRLK